MRIEGHKTRCQRLWNDTLCNHLQCLTEVESSIIIKKTLKCCIKKESKVPLGWWWMWNDNRFTSRVVMGENSENTMINTKIHSCHSTRFPLLFLSLSAYTKAASEVMWKLHEFMGAASLRVIDTYRTSLHYFTCARM